MYYLKNTFIYLLGCARSWLQHVGSISLTRDQTWAPALGVRRLSHWTTSEVPSQVLLVEMVPASFSAQGFTPDEDAHYIAVGTKWTPS